MTTFSYPVGVKNPDVNTPAVSFASTFLFPALASITYTDTSVSASNFTVKGPIVPAGLRIRGISVNLNASWNSVSGTTLSVGVSGALAKYASGIDLQTSTGSFKIIPTFTAAQVSSQMVSLAVDTTLRLTASVSGSVVPSAGSALVIVEFF